MKRVIVALEGGHTTLIKGFTVPEVEHQLNKFVAGDQFVYLHHAEGNEDYLGQVNFVAVRPHKVVALIAA